MTERLYLDDEIETIFELSYTGDLRSRIKFCTFRNALFVVGLLVQEVPDIKVTFDRQHDSGI
jgi:hypothetical protein